MNKFYITTPIYYINDEPHIGHAYTTLAADILARYWRKKIGSNKVFFLTGTDEHGQKIQEAAGKKGLTPEELSNQLVPKFKKVWKELNISYDYFIRTTDKRHERVVRKVLNKISEKGLIYKGMYDGLYCIGCEKFMNNNDLVDNSCPLHPTKKITFRKEENYFFKINKLAKKILQNIKNDQIQILPFSRKKEIINRISQGVEDTSISREGVEWGISVPWDERQTVYVWIDALINYYSATQFLKNKKSFWPPDIQLIGKDILWFHAFIWPSLLIAADLVLPKKIFAHGFFTIEGQKMSKTLGNVIAPPQLIKKYGVDGARYLIISAMNLGDDGNISPSQFDKKYNADLANNLGNLVSRTIVMVKNQNKINYNFLTQNKISTAVAKALEKMELNLALNLIWEKIQKMNILIDAEKIWAMTETKKTQALNKLLKKIHQIALDIEPFLPTSSQRIIYYIEDLKNNKLSKKFQIKLFPRTDIKNKVEAG